MLQNDKKNCSLTIIYGKKRFLTENIPSPSDIDND